MIKDDGSVRTDAVDLEIGGTRVRVVCEDPVGMGLLRSALADHLVDEPAPAGFALRVPSGAATFHVLVDRSGFVLARVRTIEEGVAVLGSHLAGLLPPPPDTVRIRGRAFLAADSTATLAIPPLLLGQPIVERRLARASLRVVDRLAVDVGPDAHIVASGSAWPALRDLSTPVGHAPAPIEPTPLATILVPRVGDGEDSQAVLVSILAAATSSGASRADRLALAVGLAEKNVLDVPADDRSAQHAALERRGTQSRNVR